MKQRKYNLTNQNTKLLTIQDSSNNIGHQNNLNPMFKFKYVLGQTITK